MKRIAFCILAAVFMASCGRQGSQDNLKTLTDLDKALNQGRYDYVVKHTKEYLAEYPESDRGWLLLGWAYAKNDNLEKAQEAFDKCLSINKGNDNAHVGLGVIHRKSGDLDKARACYREAIRLSPDDPQANSSLLVIELLEGNHDEAVKCGEKAWKYNKVNPTIPANLCIAYHYQGNEKKRDYFYKKAKELKYARMEAIDDLIAGRTSLGDEPDKDSPDTE